MKTVLVFVFVVTAPYIAVGQKAQSNQSEAKAPTLSETLQWLRGATEQESADGSNHHEFETNGGDDSCSVTIIETRVKAGPDFWIRESFSLADIDPADIQVEKLGEGQFKKLFAGQSSVRFHTRNYAKKIINTSNSRSEGVAMSDYSFFTNDWFAPRFAKALKRAVQLCGGKPSSF